MGSNNCVWHVFTLNINRDKCPLTVHVFITDTQKRKGEPEEVFISTSEDEALWVFFKIWVMVVAAEPKGTSCNFPSMSNTLLSLTEVYRAWLPASNTRLKPLIITITPEQSGN